MTKNIQDGAFLRRAAGVGGGSGGAEGTRPLSVAPWNFTEWGHYAWDISGGEGASVCAHGIARGVCVRACERQSVLEHSWQSFSTPAAPGLHTGSGLHPPGKTGERGG